MVGDPWSGISSLHLEYVNYIKPTEKLIKTKKKDKQI